MYHCDNIDAVSDHFIEEADIGEGVFDNVAAARYAVPSHWDIGKVYKRLVLAIATVRGRPMSKQFCAPTALRSALSSTTTTAASTTIPRAIYDAYATGEVGVAIFVTLTWDAIIR